MSEATLSLDAAPSSRISEDWLAVVIGLGVFALALLSLAGLDALGWLATTSVWTDPGAALGARLEGLCGPERRRRASPHLSRPAGGSVGRRPCARRGRQAVRARLHRRLRHRLCELVHRQLGALRRGDAGRPGQIRPVLVAQAHQRRRLHHRASGRPRHRQFFPALRRMAQSRHPPRTLHQDRHRHPRRVHCGHRGGQAEPRLLAVAARRRGDRRGLSDLLAGRLSDRPQGLRLQPRMVGAARLGHLDLRRRGGDRDRRRDPRPAAGAGARLVAGGDLRGRSKSSSCR